MTIYSPTYQFPAPELLVGSADGPAAFQALNARLETQMPTLRAQSENNGEGFWNVATGTTLYKVAEWVVSTVVNGWIDVDFSIDHVPVAGGVSCIGGQVVCRLDSSTARSMRFHNDCTPQAHATVSGTVSKALTTATTSVAVQLFVSVDATSQTASFRRWQVAQRQYGALAG